ncbi:hypothetical protein ACR6C2_08605 [Streptomyces sp. INA 01156]
MSAEVFKDAVDEAGQNWPPGWVKGKGYVDPEAADESSYRFENWARRSIANRTAGDYYKRQRLRSLEMYIFPPSATATFGPPSTSARRRSARGSTRCGRRRSGAGGKPKDMSPETCGDCTNCFRRS